MDIMETNINKTGKIQISTMQRNDIKLRKLILLNY